MKDINWVFNAMVAATLVGCTGGGSRGGNAVVDTNLAAVRVGAP